MFVVALFAALMVAAPAFAQDDDEWADLGEAEMDGDRLEEDEPVDEEEEAPRNFDDDDAAAAAPAEGEMSHEDVMKRVSAGTGAGTMAFIGTGVGVGAAISAGALAVLIDTLSNGGFNGDWLIWLGFWTFPVFGAAGGAAYGAFNYVDPGAVGVTAGAAAGGAAVGALLGWGLGAALAFTTQPVGVFPGENGFTFAMATGIFLGTAAGAGAGAATAIPFFVDNPLVTPEAE
jgi:hypothetical protein